MRTLKKFISFCIVGGLAALVELGVFNLAYIFGNFFVLSKILGILFALCFNFIINRKFTFLATKGLLKKQIPRFLTVYALAFFVNISVSYIVNILLPSGGLYVNIAAASGIIAQIPVSFLGSLKWTFSEK
ncbi:MAG: GtrA family protein [Minisyncoccales bacterium]